MRQGLSRTNAHVRVHTHATSRIELVRPLLNGSGRDIPPTLNDAHSQVFQINRIWHQMCYHTLHTYHNYTIYIYISHQFEQVVLININIHIMFSVHCILVSIIMSRYQCSSRELIITHSHPNSIDCLSRLKNPIRYLNVISFSQTQRLCNSL